MGGHEEVRQIIIVDFASDGLVAVRGAGVLQHSFVVPRVDPNQFERCRAECGVGGAQVVEVGCGFG